MTYFEFTVTGKGLFPTDMLSHERCYPVSAEDAVTLEWSYNLMRNKKTNPTRSIRLASMRKPKENASPDKDAWEGSGWTVEVHRD